VAKDLASAQITGVNVMINMFGAFDQFSEKKTGVCHLFNQKRQILCKDEKSLNYSREHSTNWFPVPMFSLKIQVKIKQKSQV
jgi:hypothetical protein